MALWTVIPVKPFARGKSRLAGVLDARERAALNRRLFEHVFDTARRTLGADHIVVVSTDAALLARVRAEGAHAIAEPAGGGLNTALAQAAAHAIAREASAVLVLPADLPELTSEDIGAIAAALAPTPCCVIAPDSAGRGTNALALAPPTADAFHFGPGSFSVHLAAMRERRVEILRRPGLARDLDTPEDYRLWLQRARAPA